MDTMTKDPSRFTQDSNYDHGEPRTWEITWTDGRKEQVVGHQCRSEVTRYSPKGDSPWSTANFRVEIHGVAAGRWELIFSGRSDDITAVRLTP